MSKMLSSVLSDSQSLGDAIRASVTLKSGSAGKRRSSVSTDNWARFRLLLSQDQLDRLSYCYGELEGEDGIGRI